MILVKVYVNANGVLKIEYPDGTIKSPRSGSLSITQQVNGINIEIDGIPVTGKALQISEIGKANDDAYANFAELETTVKDFFKKASSASLTFADEATVIAGTNETAPVNSRGVLAGFLNWVVNKTFAGFNTTSKTIQGAINELFALRGVANGVAPLDSSLKVPAANLPSALAVGSIETTRSQSTDKAVASKLFDDYSSKATGLYISDNLELFNNLLGLGEFISTDRWWYDTAHYVTKDFIVRKIKIRTKNSLSGQDNFGYIRKFKIIDNVSVFTSEAILITGVSENTNEYILARPFILSQNEYIAFNFRAVTYFAGVAGSYLKDTTFTVNFEGHALSYSLVGSYANEFPSTLKITTDEILYQLNKIQTLKSISGKKFSILGDSISTFSGVNGVSNPFYPYLDLNSSNMTWWGKLVSIGAVLNYNNSIGGTRIYMDMVSRSFQLFSNGASGVSPDIIFIFGGTNDYVSNVQTPIGSLEDGDTDPTISFCSSYSNIIKNIKATYQNVNIVLITPFALEYNQSTIYQNKHGQKLGDFIYAIKSVGDKYGCSVIDLYRSISNISYEKYDGAHPKESLHSKITDAILKQLIF